MGRLSHLTHAQGRHPTPRSRYQAGSVPARARPPHPPAGSGEAQSQLWVLRTWGSLSLQMIIPPGSASPLPCSEVGSWPEEGTSEAPRVWTLGCCRSNPPCTCSPVEWLVQGTQPGGGASSQSAQKHPKDSCGPQAVMAGPSGKDDLLGEFAPVLALVLFLECLIEAM